MTQVTSWRQRMGRTFVHVVVGAVAVGALSLSVLTAGAGASASHKTKALAISIAKNATLGTILVGSNKTVYTLKASKTSCSSACVKVWPEVLLPKGVKHATAKNGVQAAKLGTIKRGSRRQVTYGGKALYWFVGDTVAGQANGNVTDQWGKWSSVVTAKPALGTAPTGGATTTPSSQTPTTTKVTPTTTRSTSGTTPPPTTPTTRPPTPTTSPPPPPTTTPTTSPPPPPTTTPPTTTPTTAPGGGGVGF